MSRPTVMSFVRGTTDERNFMLMDMISDLLVEVEALREAVIRLSTNIGTDTAPYREAYRETALLSHNCAGPSSGMDKVLARFYPDSSGTAKEPLREVIMLRRLGMGQSELDLFEKEAKGLEVLT